MLERKAQAEATRLDLLLFGRPAVTAAILAVVDKLTHTTPLESLVQFLPSPPHSGCGMIVS